ncbi:hypothetical protein HDU97_008656, partial [Phlyctochytrium planicorne]
MSQRYERVNDDDLLFDRPSFDEVPLVTSSRGGPIATPATIPVSSTSSYTATTTTTTASSSSIPTGPSSASRTANGASAGTSSTAVGVGLGNDGVFSNLNASNNPSGASYEKNFDEIEPPSYQDAVYETSPSYLDATVVSSFSDDGDVVVEGYPVGNFFTFFVNLIVSMSFDFIGFLLTSMLATSHAAK